MEQTSSSINLPDRVWFRHCLSEGELLELEAAISFDPNVPGKRLSVSELPSVPLKKLNEVARRVLSNAKPVRAVSFEKNADTNWAVPWHQDLVVAVQDRFELQGFKSWTRKSGVWHVQPPLKFLERMIFLRVWLDKTDSRSGDLEVVPGSHYKGIVDPKSAAGIANSSGIEVLTGDRGDVLAVTALTIHRSQSTGRDARRRAVRIDYCADELPAPLKWAN